MRLRARNSVTMTFASSQVPQSTAPNASTRERARTHSPGESLTGRIYTPWLDKQRTKRRTENSSVRMTCGARTPWPIAGHARYGARRAERPPLQAPTFSTRRVAMYARPGAAPRSVGPTRNAAPWRAHSTNHGPHGVRSSSSAFDTLYVLVADAATTSLWEAHLRPALAWRHRAPMNLSLPLTQRRLGTSRMICLCTRRHTRRVRSAWSHVRAWATRLCWTGS